MAIFEEKKRSYVTLHREAMDDQDKKEKKNEYY